MIKAYISIGSNIDPEKNICSALAQLKKTIKVTGTSLFYRTKPLLNREQSDYLNGVWSIETDLEPEFVKYKILKKIEKKQGRKKTKDKFGSRTIDLDLILYGDQVLNSDKISIPDKDIYERAFIAIPLYELDNTLVIPDTKTKIKDIIKKFSEIFLIPEIVFTEKLKNIINEKS